MTSALRWGWVVSTTPRPLYPRERPGTHCTGGWVGSRAGLDGCGKSYMTKLIAAFHNFVNTPKNKCKENRREKMKEKKKQERD
jgi:hypothetical protein